MEVDFFLGDRAGGVGEEDKLEVHLLGAEGSGEEKKGEDGAHERDMGRGACPACVDRDMGRMISRGWVWAFTVW